MAKLIKRDWRNWKPQQTPSGKRLTPGSDSSQSLGDGVNKSSDGGFDISKAVKPKAVKKKVITLSGKMQDIKSLPIKKTPARVKLHGNKTKFKNNNFNYKSKNIGSSEKYRKLDNFDVHLKWSREIIFEEKRDYKYNKDRAHSIVVKANETRDKRLSGALAVMISKLAEDKSGEPIIGEDEWDIQELMMRSLTRRNIYSCMQSRERENIVLVLDSSPSCERSARFYSKIAYLSCKLGNLDIYLAPNARITHKMNAKTREYEKVFDINKDENMIICGMDCLHNFFRNRVILFFGDYDGKRMICEASKSNEVYWLNNDYEGEEIHKEGLYGEKFYGTVFNVSSKEDLINTIRKLR